MYIRLQNACYCVLLQVLLIQAMTLYDQQYVTSTHCIGIKVVDLVHFCVWHLKICDDLSQLCNVHLLLRYNTTISLNFNFNPRLLLLCQLLANMSLTLGSI